MSITVKQSSNKDDFSRDSFVSIRDEEEFESLAKKEEINLDLKPTTNREKFEDLPLHLTNSEKQNIQIKPHLIVEDKGEKKD